MKMMKKWLSLLLAAVMALSIAAVSAEEAPAIELVELTAETPVAKVNGEEITWGACAGFYDSLVSEYGSYYDLTVPANEALFRAVAMNEAVTQALLDQKAADLGLNELTEEEKADIIAQVGEDWDASIASYMEQEGVDEATAVAHYQSQGYTKEFIENVYVEEVVYEKLFTYFTQSAVVTDEEVQGVYDAQVAEDKALYENDLEGYMAAVAQAKMLTEFYYSYYGIIYEINPPTYKPAGFRNVTHILLTVDEELLNNYNGLVARFEEQQSEAEDAEEAAAEEAAEEPAETEAPVEPVTEDMISEAMAAILASRADDIQAIYARYEAGEDFESLIDAYESKDGHSLYEICEYSTSSYVEPFVTAAMSIGEIGGLSDPAVSQFGIHIVQYLGDVEAGPVPLTDDEFEALRSELLSAKQQELCTVAMDEYKAASEVEYYIPTVEEVEQYQ